MGRTLTLQVFTARISYPGIDRLDVTRQGESAWGKSFAPSWPLLTEALDALKLAARIEADARHHEKTVALHRPDLAGSVTAAARREAAEVRAAAWASYKPKYLAEMRVSYRERRGAWDQLLARERMTLVCFCVDLETCHRKVLRTEILPPLGAYDMGEVLVEHRRRA